MSMPPFPSNSLKRRMSMKGDNRTYWTNPDASNNLDEMELLSREPESTSARPFQFHSSNSAFSVPKKSTSTLSTFYGQQNIRPPPTMNLSNHHYYNRTYLDNSNTTLNGTHLTVQPTEAAYNRTLLGNSNTLNTNSDLLVQQTEVARARASLLPSMNSAFQLSFPHKSVKFQSAPSTSTAISGLQDVRSVPKMKSAPNLQQKKTRYRLCYSCSKKAAIFSDTSDSEPENEAEPEEAEVEARAEVEIEPQRKPEEIFYVEKILSKRIRNGQEQYLVKWMGYSSSYNSWEPISSFNNPILVETYEKNLKDKINAKRLKNKKKRRSTGFQ